MTDKEFKAKILAEIERLFVASNVYSRTFKNGQRHALMSLKDFINSLPEEPVSEDLEEAAKQYATVDRSDGDGGIDLMKLESFIAGAQWQKRQTIDKACEWLNKNTGFFNEKNFRKAMEGD